MRFVPVRFSGSKLWVGGYHDLPCIKLSYSAGTPCRSCYPVHGGCTGWTPLVNGCVASRAYKLSFLLLALHKCVLRCVAALHILYAPFFYFCVHPFLDATPPSRAVLFFSVVLTFPRCSPSQKNSLLFWAGACCIQNLSIS